MLRETAPKIGSKFLDAASQYDHVFWIGDLNYRTDLRAGGVVDKDVDDAAHHAKVLKLVDSEDWATLLECDQLNMCKAKGDAFVGFSEGQIAFKPTFKAREPSRHRRRAPQPPEPR